ncbi:MAG: hypothetical protein SFV54_18265 [Bryobacteraceae bacterium]|nr:hypothetical protein [Bryobacteraceae bacterium]
MSTAMMAAPAENAPKVSRGSVLLVFLSTFIGAIAQMLIKTGAATLTGTGPLAMITNPRLMAGYSLYGLVTGLIILALRKGQLSILYPIISLTYVWVTILSVFVLNESLNPFKLLGVSVIVVGVGVLGRGGAK